MYVDDWINLALTIFGVIIGSLILYEIIYLAIRDAIIAANTEIAKRKSKEDV
jgi:hypothetical protein